MAAIGDTLKIHVGSISKSFWNASDYTCIKFHAKICELAVKRILKGCNNNEIEEHNFEIPKTSNCEAEGYINMLDRENELIKSSPLIRELDETTILALREDPLKLLNIPCHN